MHFLALYRLAAAETTRTRAWNCFPLNILDDELTVLKATRTSLRIAKTSVNM